MASPPGGGRNIVGRTSDMARIEPLPPKKWPGEMREAMAVLIPPHARHPLLVAEGRPKALNMLGTLAHHPNLAKAFHTFNGHVLLGTTLTTRQREMLVLRVAAVRKSGYEWAQHLYQARDVGLTDEEIARVAYGPDAPFWSPLDAALLSSVDELILDGGISEPTWAVLVAELDEQQVLDIIYTVGVYEILSWMVQSFQLDLDDDLRPTS
jgi:alkylhydroperoxidase family enzyme